MSADSPNHTLPELAPLQNVVTPQPVTDPTILDSVAGFINEVVPTTGGDSFDSKDQIQWARFENLDFDESNFSPTGETALPSSLVLVLGYTTGVQVWAVPANGEATELFSWRHGSVKVLRILPAPYEVGTNKRDLFETKRPLVALVDVASHGSSAGSLNFYSLKSGEQVKQIKFKTQILDVIANRRSVVITFQEKIAVFDAFTLEDKLSVTSCYLSPGIQPNPVALGPRWLAFAEKKLISSRRSSGGNEGEGVQSYTATVLHAAKSLGRGLRELGDAVASSLTGNQGIKLGSSPNSPQAGGSADVPQKGIVTVLDVENSSAQNADGSFRSEAIVAHFIAHTEAIVWLQFGPCGMLILTADKRGHDFNLFRINPHPVGSALAAIHHLYTLHRGDTSSRVQDMCFSFDSRWVTVSTLRGTTHVFPITPYGSNIGVRTHTTPHVVNKMSRFHRSAGLTSEGRSNSPVSMFESPVSSNFPYHNPRFSPFPHPTVVNPLAQLRQPVYMQNIGNTAPRQGRQRLTSSSEDNIALRVTACFAPARAWIDSTASPRETGLSKSVKPVESLFVMNCHGTLVQYDLDPHAASGIPKEKVCDDSPVDLTVTARAQWRLQRQPTTLDRPLPLPHQSLAFVTSTIPGAKKKIENGNDDDWLSQVEIITHAGPHRRLWMGPQFTFKTYTTSNGTTMSLADAQPLDLNRSKPVNMPITKANAVLIESSSASSSEQSLLDIYRKNCDEMGVAGEHQIKEDLADAMIESPGIIKDIGGKSASPLPQRAALPPIAKVVNPLGTVVTVQSDDDADTPPLPEDNVIYENCDETLFRPTTSPKTLAYCKSSKADAGHIMTQSLRGDTNVTVRVMDKAETTATTNWEDLKCQDIGNNTKVIVQEGEVRDLMVQKNLKVQPTKEEPIVKSDASKSPQLEVVHPKKERKTPERSTVEKATKSYTKKSYERESPPKSLGSTDNRSSAERDTKKKPKADKKAPSKDDMMPDFEESAYGLVNPLYNVLEECERVKPKQPDEPKVGKKSKNKRTCQDTVDGPEIPKQVPEIKDFSEAMPLSKINKKPKADLEEISSASNFLKDLEPVAEITFPALDTKLTAPEFPPLEENFFSLENLCKQEKYEDAMDCGLPLEPVPSFFAADLDTAEDSNTTDDNTAKKKGSIKKPRKPKAKLGVKIQGTVTKEESPERSCVPDEITLPAPKRSWSSIAASKPVEPLKADFWSNNDNNNNDDEVPLAAESFTIPLPPKKSVTTEKLLDIDTPEERNDMTTAVGENLLDTEQLNVVGKTVELPVESADLLKLSDKSSDDEKNESGSSPVETTESSDEGKLQGSVPDDLGSANVTSVSAASKTSAKRRLKKKKK